MHPEHHLQRHRFRARHSCHAFQREHKCTYDASLTLILTMQRCQATLCCSKVAAQEHPCRKFCISLNTINLCIFTPAYCYIHSGFRYLMVYAIAAQEKKPDADTKETPLHQKTLKHPCNGVVVSHGATYVQPIIRQLYLAQRGRFCRKLGHHIGGRFQGFQDYWGGNKRGLGRVGGPQICLKLTATTSGSF